MMESHRACNITAITKRSLTRSLLNSLISAGICDCHISAARTIILHEKKKGFGLFHPFRLVEDQVDMISFFIDPNQEEQGLDLVIHHGELTLPGRGTVYSEEVTLFESREFSQESKIRKSAPGVKKQSPLTGLCCVIQRGQANMVARVALEIGASVPAITFGLGTGIRDKLGLLRIAIPAEKEIIHLAVSTYDADTIMKMMISAGNLGQPGKGFIFTYPIHKGLIDTEITRGINRHVASIEQIIATVDELKGDIGWRRHTGHDMIMLDEQYLLLNLSDLTLVCNEGRGQELVKEAMRAGAGGATISKMKYQRALDSKSKSVSPAREACNMAVTKSQLDGILNALEDAGAFDEKTCGQLFIRPVPKAFTYS